MTKKTILFIGSGLAEVELQKIIVFGLALNYKVFLMWTAETNCNSDCHPETGRNEKKSSNVVDLGHIDLKVFEELPKVLQKQWDDITVGSINLVVSVPIQTSLIIINLPTTRSQSKNLILELREQINKSDSLSKQALVVTNSNEAKLVLLLFKRMFKFYEIINLDYDQIDSRMRISKSEIIKIYFLIENLN